MRAVKTITDMFINTEPVVIEPSGTRLPRLHTTGRDTLGTCIILLPFVLATVVILLI